jgi:hypothetical protein
VHPLATGVSVDPDMAAALVDELARIPLDPGLILDRSKVVDCEGSPILAIRYVDGRHPEAVLGAWWGFHNYEEYVHEPSEAAWLASHAGVWLDEVFHTVPLEAFAKDEHGVLWAMMDFPTREDVGRIPPRQARG